MDRPRPRHLLLAVLLAAVAAPVIPHEAATGATSKVYSGRTDQRHTLTFRVVSQRVTAFRTMTRLSCPGRAARRVSVRPAARPVIRDGRFSTSGRLKDGTAFAIKGTVGKRSAVGTVSVSRVIAASGERKRTVCRALLVGWRAAARPAR